MEITGMKKVNFTPKDSDSVIEGYNLYLTYEARDTAGYACERIFVSEYRLGEYVPALGDEVHVNYNRFGKVDSVVRI